MSFRLSVCVIACAIVAAIPLSAAQATDKHSSPPATYSPSASAPKSETSTPNSTVVQVRSSDTAMNAAIVRGKATFPRFMQLWNQKRPGEYSVKFALNHDGNTEHIWLIVTKISGNTIRGRLQNTPIYATQYRLGQVMTIQKAQVEDWIVDRQDGLWGGYTNRVVLAIQNGPDAVAQINMYQD
jgi:uncharacterized protein YegJ (DUF2314 family)